MSINRKNFLQLTLAGGLGVLFGGMAPASFWDKGSRLVIVRRKSLLMGSVASFEVVAPGEEEGYEAIRRAVDVFKALDQTLSMYRADSEMAGLAEQAGREPVEVSGDARFVLAKAKEIYRRTAGLFDVTLEPAMRLWGFRTEKEQPVEKPTEEQLRKLERVIGSEKLLLEGRRAQLKHKGMSIDVGGIAGGYALDRAIEEMKKCDLQAAFINFSGDIACFGTPLSRKNWNVHILDPHTGEPLESAVPLHNQAMSTSGAYQNRRRAPGRSSWGHLLNPRKGSPVEPVASVTAVHSSAMIADAWSTARFVGAEVPRDVKTYIL